MATADFLTVNSKWSPGCCCCCGYSSVSSWSRSRKYVATLSQDFHCFLKMFVSLFVLPADFSQTSTDDTGTSPIFNSNFTWWGFPEPKKLKTYILNQPEYEKHHLVLGSIICVTSVLTDMIKLSTSSLGPLLRRRLSKFVIQDSILWVSYIIVR